jgi:hypothetical protein
MASLSGYIKKLFVRPPRVEVAPKAVTADAVAGPEHSGKDASIQEASRDDQADSLLDALPTIDSITATTDIRGFLKHGVPDSLKHAALRRAWVADPAIRDFVGIAENQWDFNKPQDIPGFGLLDPLWAVGRLIPPASAGVPVANVIAPAPPHESLATSDRPMGRTAAGIDDHPIQTGVDKTEGSAEHAPSTGDDVDY